MYTPMDSSTISFIKIENIGPAASLEMELAKRLNIVTGDNGLGKSFLMECAWWALTGEWTESPAYPTDISLDAKHTITYELADERGEPVRSAALYDIKGGWTRNAESAQAPCLSIYAKADASYALWDPIKRQNIFVREHIWNGVDGKIDGLMRDWVKWQSMPQRYPFDKLVSALKSISPPDMGTLMPGNPIRMPNDIRDTPTIIYKYGEAPIQQSSAGVKQVLTLVYLIVWLWHEHNINAGLRKEKPANRLVIFIDEIEAHLHPKWQRTILPAILDIGNLLSKELNIQFVISTHSPLALASVETYFDTSTDKLFNICANERTGFVEISNMNFIKYGHINSWLTSPIFNLVQARSKEAEKAIEKAKRIQLQESPLDDEIAEVHKELVKELPQLDPFWPRWIYYAESHGVEI